MPAPVIVPDASVLLKWGLSSPDERDRDLALALKESWLSGTCDLIVPSLWLYEVGNILIMKRPAEAEALLQAIIDLDLEETRPALYLTSILGLIRRFKVTFYDASYHGLAIERGGLMLTADEAYFRKTQRAGHVALLSNWSPPMSRPKRQSTGL